MEVKITKTHLVLLGIFVLALVLRVIAGLHTPIWSDEEAYSVVPIDIISAGRLGTVEQSTLYFYTLDVGYKIFGVNAFSTRLPSIIFGSLAVILVFFFVLELFGKKEGLIAAFLFAVSGYALRFNIEMDMMAFFFVLLGMLLFVKYVKNGNKWFVYCSALAFALAVLIKPITALFAPVFIGMLLFMVYKKQMNLKHLIIVGAVFAVAFAPVFAYNYLTYNENGVTDYYFSVILGVGKSVYSGIEGESWSVGRLFAVGKGVLERYFSFDPVMLVFGVLSLGYVAWKKRENGIVLMIVGTLVFVLYMAGKTGSSSHYLWLPIVFAVCSSVVLAKLKTKHVLLLLGVLFVFNIFMVKDIITDKYPVLSLRDYAVDSIPSNALVVVDPRVYRGITAWTFNDKHYLEGTYFPQLVEAISTDDSPRQNYPLYYIECGKETTCTWSTEDYQRVYNFSEQLKEVILKNTEKAADITGGSDKPGYPAHHFMVYKGMISLPQGALEAADSTHMYWFYPVRWKGEIMDKYEAHGIGVLFNALGFMVLYVELLIVVLVIPATLLMLFRRKNDGENNV